MKIVLFGRGGQVGRELELQLPSLGHMVAFGRDEADLEHPDAIRSLLRRESPDIVVNAAAYTAVDKAESEPEHARQINADTVGVIATETAQLGGWLVHYSTDYVFDGAKSDSYVETDPTGPLGVYGATKLAGEQMVAASGCRHLIFRTSWVYAAHGSNFIRTILRLAQDREELSVVDDQIGAPTSAARIGGLPLRVDPDRVHAIPSSAWPQAARRPANSRLNTSRLRSTFDVTLPPWQDDVRQVVATLIRQATRE